MPLLSKMAFHLLMLLMVFVAAQSHQPHILKSLKVGSIRKQLAISAATFGLFMNTLPSMGVSEDNIKVFANERYHTSVSYPADWERREGTLSGGRPLDAFVDPTDPDTSLTVVFNPIPADYTRLTSFGGKEGIRDYLIPKGDGVSTTTLSEDVKGEVYSVEYIVSAPDAPIRHVQSVFALRPQECVVGLVVQTKEETFEKNKAKISKIVPSLMVDLKN